MSEDFEDDNRVEAHHLNMAAAELFGTWTKMQYRKLEKVMAGSYQRGIDDTKGGGPWTVIVLWDDDGTVETIPINKAKDAHDAMAQAAGGDRDYSNEIQIIGCIQGDHKITTPCDDTYKAAYMSDLKPEDDQ